MRPAGRCAQLPDLSWLDLDSPGSAPGVPVEPSGARQPSVCSQCVAPTALRPLSLGANQWYWHRPRCIHGFQGSELDDDARGFLRRLLDTVGGWGDGVAGWSAPITAERVMHGLGLLASAGLGCVVHCLALHRLFACDQSLIKDCALSKFV